MFKSKETIGIILARGGSKGIPRKNIKMLNGKPLIYYVIKTGLKSKYINRLIVSTDDKEIAEVAKRYGAEVPFIRPAYLATDEATGIDAIIHCIDWLKKEEDFIPEDIIHLQVTSPFITADDINRAYEKFYKSKASSLIGVTRVDKNPYWMKKINEDGYLEAFVKDNKVYARRQELPPVYVLNGAIYIAKTEALTKNRSFETEKTLPYIMPEERSVDIDNNLDWKFAEFLMEEKYND